jgi:FemAB-related protein (PEP-CTERM system-associated)
MSIHIKKDDQLSPLWDDYVHQHPQGTIYHLSQWKNAIEKTFHLTSDYFIATDKDKICGILPLFKIFSIFSGMNAISIPYSVYGGILADNSQIELDLLEFALDFVKNNKIGYLELRYLHDPNLDLPQRDSHVTYIKKLAEDPESILLSIPKKSRASVRNGYKKFNLKMEIHRDLDILYHLYCLNKRKLGSPAYPKSFFVNLMTEFGDQAKIMTIFYEEKPVASVLYFYFKDCCLPYFSGSDPRYLFTNANNVLYYELMKQARSERYPIFDFGRSRINSGAGDFKRNMGFEPTPLNYYYYSIKSDNISNISPSNKKFEILGNIWKNMPLAITRFLGPKIVKHIP